MMSWVGSQVQTYFDISRLAWFVYFKYVIGVESWKFNSIPLSFRSRSCYHECMHTDDLLGVL